MLNAIALVKDPAALAALERLSADSGLVSVAVHSPTLPAPFEFARMRNGCAAEFAFIELTEVDFALEMVRTLRKSFPELAIVGMGAAAALEREREIRDAGVMALLTAPISDAAFAQGVSEAFHVARAGIFENLVAFLPGKAGSGTTTIALNVAGCLANDFEKSVALIECDLESGILSFLLNTRPEQPIGEALNGAAAIDNATWRSALVSAFGVDFLLTDLSKPIRKPTWVDVYHLLRFARTRYDCVLVDLPEVLDEAMLEVVLRAHATYIVCTSELPSLRLTDVRAENLRSRGVEEARIHALLNRWKEDSVNPGNVEKALRAPVAGVIPNDYKEVYSATIKGRLVGEETELGQAYTAFARKLLHIPEPEPAKGMFERFRYAVGRKS